MWNGYLAIIKSSHVSISNEDDVLVWNLSKFGHYTTKDGYAQLMMDREVEYSWWWRVLWKLKFPLKTKIFCWFILLDKALTWDVLVKKAREGPNRCFF